MDDFKIEIPRGELIRAMKDINFFSDQVNEDVQGLIRRSTLRVAARAKVNAPNQHGKLRQSITTKISGMTGEVAVNVDYAGAVEFGSRPHKIRPRRKKALAFKPGAGFRFWDESGRVVVKEVDHPGTEAQPFLRPAVEKEVQVIGRELKRIIENATKR